MRSGQFSATRYGFTHAHARGAQKPALEQYDISQHIICLEELSTSMKLEEFGDFDEKQEDTV